MEFTQSAERLKGEPLSPFTQVGIYFTTSVEPALSGWWRARTGPNFGPNFRTKTIFETKKREIPTTYDDVVATLTEEPPYLILPQAGS